METNTKCSFCGEPLYRRILKPLSFCNIKCKSEYQKLARPVTVEWLRRKYIDEGLDCTQIGLIVNRDPKSVWSWLTGSGIQTRPRGSFEGVKFKKGQESAFKGKSHTPENKELIRAARLKDGRVPYLKNGKHHLVGKRGADTPNWKGGLTPERQAFYSSREWAESCKAVWHRADAKCERCGLDHRTIDRKKMSFAIHHIRSFAIRELRAEVSNLALLCRPCHLWVHSKKNVNKEFLA